MLKDGEGIVYNNYYKLLIILLVTNDLRADSTTGSYFNNVAKEQDELFQKYLSDYYTTGGGSIYIEVSSQIYLELEKAFKTNLVLIDYFNARHTTASFGINRFSGITFDKFVQGYTGFNGSGLTDEGVVEFDPQYVEQIPPKMDWTHSLTIYYMSYCKNSYIYSALSKYCIFYCLS